MSSVPPSPSKVTNSNGSIAFPIGFLKIKEKSVPSSINSDLETGLFSYQGKEYPADSYSGLILREMGWTELDKANKERIVIHWVDQVIHLNGILFSPGGFEGENAHFGDHINIFKPSFSYPKIEFIDKSNEVKVTYWHKNERKNIVNYHEIIISKNGDIKSRRIISSEQKQFYIGIANTLILGAAFVGYYLLKYKQK